MGCLGMSDAGLSTQDSFCRSFGINDFRVDSQKVLTF
jgi:hypothetical protein